MSEVAGEDTLEPDEELSQQRLFESELLADPRDILERRAVADDGCRIAGRQAQDQEQMTATTSSTGITASAGDVTR
jgi:hypothetical protein